MTQEQAAYTRLAEITAQLHGYSRRYCDNSRSYAAADHNMLTHQLLSMGVHLPADPLSVSGPFARDGSYGLGREEQAVLDKSQQTNPAPHYHEVLLTEQLQKHLQQNVDSALDTALKAQSGNQQEQPDKAELRAAVLTLAAHYLAAKCNEQEINHLVSVSRDYVNARENADRHAYSLYLELKTALKPESFPPKPS